MMTKLLLQSVPSLRVSQANRRPVNARGDYVLYWMTAFRRSAWNFSLDRALDWAEELKKPLLIFEALRCDYPWAGDRLHRFILDGMADNVRSFKDTAALYYPYVEPEKGAARGLLEALSAQASLIVTDDYPCFFLPRMISAAARKVDVRMETVDGNGLLPMDAATRAFPTAYAFRRFLQKELPRFLLDQPGTAPFKGRKLKTKTPLPKSIVKRWPPASSAFLRGDSQALTGLPIDHRVKPAPQRGGSREADRTLSEFIEDRILRYPLDRNQPELEGTSGLSPYLHFGHVSVHQIFRRIMEKEDWFIDRLSPKASGAKAGWWGMSEGAEGFLDELITWRELGFNMCRHRRDYDRYASLPDWARATLQTHEMDRRPYLYGLKDFESARTHDPLWNAAQTQLVSEGRIHNYLRMLWGKKILHWTPTPEKALEIMTHLNNKYALDGRDPNSYSGIFWVLGRYDRAWGPERPVFGKIRYMSSRNTARKVRVKNYVRIYSS